MDHIIQDQLLSELRRPGLPWKTSQRHEAPGDSLRWLPVGSMDAARLKLGLSFDGWWTVLGPNTATELKPGVRYVFLLPILEIPVSKARGQLADGLRQSGLSEGFLTTFPFEGVVVAGLDSQSEQWESLALKWAEQLPASMKLLHALQANAEHGKTQQIRHAAKKLAVRKRIENRGAIGVSLRRVTTMAKIQVNETSQGFDYWCSRPYLSEDVRRSLTNAKIILVPEEGFRDRDVRVFPVGTEGFLTQLREKLPHDVALEIAINDDDYKEVALHSAVLILGAVIVTGVTLVVLPVLVNVVSEYINRRLYSDKDRTQATVRWELTVVEGSRAARISYEGPVIDFQSAMQRAISEIPTMGPSSPSLTRRAEDRNENAR